MGNHQTLQNTLYFNQISEISQDIWNDLDCNNKLYFHPKYLAALEKNNSHLDFFYVVLKNEHNKAIAFASVQMIDFFIDSLQNENQSILTNIACIGRKLRILPREKPLKILNCGNTFVSGEHGIFIKSDQNKRKVLRKLAKAILKYSQQQYQDPDIFIIKDFLEESLPISNELISLGYYAFNVEPNMKLNVNSHWNSFDDYLNALKTKFRVKAKRALELSKGLKTIEITSKNIDDQLVSMTNLYQKVASKAYFNLGDFNLKTYKDLKEQFKEDYILKSYWLQNKMVGFLSGSIHENILDAHFVGIDYRYNKQFAIYQRMLYDYIDIAIKQKLDTINFARTASEIKSSVGAIPEHMTIYIRHKKTITNKFLKLFLLRIQPTEFHQKFPFKMGSNSV
ncbi:GNAT family N-acetyltransferase [Pseudotenacibaculum sp. MALMAid0570]|uniref:GNAT family N-acetyltransferase n=1 Tax=Pseudotenacibaculum sp. MALMAid0570 TaxID=3143938 RepID=UPI0032DF8DC5